MPADRRPLEFLRLLLGEKVEQVERIFERNGAKLAQRRLRRPEVGLLDRTCETSMRRALAAEELDDEHVARRGEVVRQLPVDYPPGPRVVGETQDVAEAWFTHGMLCAVAAHDHRPVEVVGLAFLYGPDDSGHTAMVARSH
jgi:hypothetical protein